MLPAPVAAVQKQHVGALGPHDLHAGEVFPDEIAGIAVIFVDDGAHLIHPGPAPGVGPQQGGHADMAEAAALDLRQLPRIGVGQVQVAAQDRHVQLSGRKDPAGVQRQPRIQGRVVKFYAGDDLGVGQVYAGKALLPGLLRPGLHGLLRGGKPRVDIVQTNS